MTAHIELDDVVERASVWTEGFGAIDVVFDPATATVRKLNPVATRMWRMLDRPRSVRDVIGAVVPHDATEGLSPQTDALRFLQQLVDWGVLLRVNGSFA